jgi:hypothetical protein
MNSDIQAFVKSFIGRVTLSVIREYATTIDSTARCQITNKNLKLASGTATGQYVKGWSDKSCSQQTAILEAWRREHAEEARKGNCVSQEQGEEVGRRGKSGKGGKPSRTKRKVDRALQDLTSAEKQETHGTHTFSEEGGFRRQTILGQLSKRQQQYVRSAERSAKHVGNIVYPRKCPEPGCGSSAICKYQRAIYCYRCQTETTCFAETSGEQGCESSCYSPS